MFDFGKKKKEKETAEYGNKLSYVLSDRQINVLKKAIDEYLEDSISIGEADRSYIKDIAESISKDEVLDGRQLLMLRTIVGLKVDTNTEEGFELKERLFRI